MSKAIDLLPSAELIIHKLLAVRPKENVMIIRDPGSEMDMAYALAGLAQSRGAEYTIAVMPRRHPQRANALTPIIEKGLEAADCLIGMTRYGGAPTYASKVKELYDAGTLRTISMVMRGYKNFTQGGALADYESLYEEGVAFAETWDSARRLRVTTPAGTRFECEIGAAKSIVECGFATEAGQEAAFPDGEVSQGPNEGTAQGTIVVDGPMAYLGMPDRPITLQITKGRVGDVMGDGTTAQRLGELLRTIPNTDNIAEVGIGLNPDSLENGDFEEEKKGRGKVHIALGDNIFFGGTTKSQMHMDMVLYRASVWLDDQLVVESGQFCWKA